MIYKVGWTGLEILVAHILFCIHILILILRFTFIILPREYAKREGVKLINIDGSYLFRKHLQLQTAGVNVVAHLPFTLFSLYGNSATCTHVSVLLHALVAMSPTQLTLGSSTCNVTEDLPVTLYPCQLMEA